MIAIIDYRAGNLKSVERALRHLGLECSVTQDQEEVSGAARIIFPGVGAAGKAVADLRHLGLDEVLIKAFGAGKPILGICLGTQIILERSEENNTQCLGILEGEVKRFPTPLFSLREGRLKIPHMGWNTVKWKKPHPVIKGIMPTDEFYFVHSYFPLPQKEDCVIGTTDYGVEFPSVIGYKNLIATQFHPEKSGPPGLRFLQNFCSWDGHHAE